MGTSNHSSVILSETNQRTYHRLQQALRLQLRHQIFIAVCDNINLRNYLAQQLETDLLSPNQSKISSPLIRLKLDLTDPNPFEAIARWSAQNPSNLEHQRIIGFQILILSCKPEPKKEITQDESGKSEKVAEPVTPGRIIAVPSTTRVTELSTEFVIFRSYT